MALKMHLAPIFFSQKKNIISTFFFSIEEDIFQYAKKNLAIVNVYIKDPVVTRILRDEKTPIIAFVANTGGLMGLCMGFSLVSVFEILYHMSGAFRRKMTEMNLNNATTLNGGHENNSELKELKPKVNQNGVPKGLVVL